VPPAGRPPVDVLWRRTSEERLRDDRGEPNAYGRVLLRPLAAGTVRVVDPYGTGVVDDKRTARCVEDLSGCTWGRSRCCAPPGPTTWAAPTTWPGRRTGWTGWCSSRGPAAAGAASWSAAGEPGRAARGAGRGAPDPAGWVAQEVVRLSTCATWTGSGLEPRHVDLRPCVLSDGGTVTVLPGGLTRFAPAAGDLVVNLSQGGGAKDTWVVDA
jgi:carboxylate-amine ligase